MKLCVLLPAEATGCGAACSLLLAGAAVVSLLPLLLKILPVPCYSDTEAKYSIAGISVLQM
jgi:hypothetical protein